MEEQDKQASPQQISQPSNDSNITDLDTAPAPPPGPASLSTSEPTLRFPRLQVNRQLESWVSSSQPDMMSPSSRPVDDSGLSDSTYELITTDDESQDGLATESLRSFGDSRPDDLQSLPGTEASESGIDTEPESEDEQEQEDNHSQASSIQYAEDTLSTPSSRHSSRSGVWPPEDTPRATPLVRSIEFSENEKEDLIDLKQVSVKHTIREFNTEDAAAISKSMNLPSAPGRLIATVRQTMASHCAVPDRPVRMMYVGNPSGRHLIVNKIESALAAGADASGDSACKSGPTMAPHVELKKKSPLHAGFVRLSQCTSARETIYQGSQFPGETVYTITTDEKQRHQSVYRPSGSVIEPNLLLPSLAIFYVTARDDSECIQTREAAWGFMQRHAVPCLFISESQLFDQPSSVWTTLINQHAIHLCLESSQKTPATTRLPIDLDSFLNIDDHQMNRNLTFFAGLNERNPERARIASLFTGAAKTLKEETRRIWDALGGSEVSIASVLWFLLVVLLASVGGQYLRSPILSATDQVVSTTAAGATVTPSVSELRSIESDQTAIINLTASTSTSVNIPRANVPPSNSAVAPFTNFLPDIIPETVKPPICSAEAWGGNGILVKIPLSTKTTWLAKDSITIDVLRDGQAVKTKFSSIDEGLLIEIPRKEAHGIITVRVLTSRKPKVNETFEVDFGKSVADQLNGVIGGVVERMADTAGDLGTLANAAKDLWSGRLKTASSDLESRLSVAAERAKDYLQDYVQIHQSLLFPNGVLGALDRLDERAELASLYVLRAQIASRLWWLKMQGKTEEHDEYRSKGQAFLAKKTGDFVKAKKLKQTAGDTKCGVPEGRFWRRRGSTGCKKSSR